MAQENYDQYDVGSDYLDELEKNINQRQFSGIWCPWRNDKKPCEVCRDVRKLWNMHNETKLEKSKYSERAKKYNASASVFMNVVFPDNPSEVRILQCGIKMLQALVNGMKYQDWGVVWHPAKGMTIGVIKSSDSGYNTYTPSPDIKKGVRTIEDMGVLDKLHNLDLIDDLMDTVDVFNINTIDKNRKFSFDILPGWKEAERGTFYKIVYYHYNITPEAITDGIPDLYGQEEEKVPTDFPSTTTEKTEVEEPKVVEETVVYTRDSAPGCFGKFYSENDEQCKDPSCAEIRADCAEAFANNQAQARAAK